MLSFILHSSSAFPCSIAIGLLFLCSFVLSCFVFFCSLCPKIFIFFSFFSLLFPWSRHREEESCFFGVRSCSLSSLVSPWTLVLFLARWSTPMRTPPVHFSLFSIHRVWSSDSSLVSELGLGLAFDAGFACLIVESNRMMKAHDVLPLVRSAAARKKIVRHHQHGEFGDGRNDGCRCRSR